MISFPPVTAVNFFIGADMHDSKEETTMSRELIISSIALSFFIICPRMAGMVHVIARQAQTPLMLTALFGTLMAVPLVLAMVWVFGRFGLWGALAFCVVTDALAALFMQQISLKAGIETLIIALFVIAGVKIAPLITSFIVR